MPESGMGFPERLYVQTGQTATLILRVDWVKMEERAQRYRYFQQPEIIVSTPQVAQAAQN